MSTTFQIAEVARRSGFTPATLRYYEELGLLQPAGRTDAGYRLYDESSLERLRFIARAKQLGCSLEEVAELAGVWEGGRCATVQDRLRGTIAAKAAAAEADIAELTTLVAELQRAAARLSATPVDGPCDDTCGCTTTGAPADEVPIACTLGAHDRSTRLDEWRGLLAEVTVRQRLDDGGLRLELGAGADVAAVARLAAAEQGCCGFFRFALVLDARGAALEVHAPTDGQPVLTALFGDPA